MYLLYSYYKIVLFCVRSFYLFYVKLNKCKIKIRWRALILSYIEFVFYSRMIVKSPEFQKPTQYSTQ